ncbi:hypothetical protein [Streptomyces sp. NPDC000134]|uniref:hypothetical protein n=1 Tax=Streptomyces sp. NPDC000134 TaxID=3364536 RepID=UPI0036A70387
MGTAADMVLTRERRELMREWVQPLHDAIHRPLGLAEQTDPRRYPHVPKNFSDDDAEIRIDLPRHPGFSRDAVADLITQKLALEGVTVQRGSHLIVAPDDVPILGAQVCDAADPGPQRR